jgi:intracellular septation protein A
LRRLKFIAEEFSPLIFFFLAREFTSLRMAILATMVFTVGFLVLAKIRKRPITRFFQFSALISLAFGCLDFYANNTFFMKFEGSVMNGFFALFFAKSVIRGNEPVIQEFAIKSGGVASDRIDQDLEFFFKLMTWIWVAYFLLKAAFYGYVGLSYSFEEGILIRSVVGNITLYGLIFLTTVLSRPAYRLCYRFRLLPSLRSGEDSSPVESKTNPRS